MKKEYIINRRYLCIFIFISILLVISCSEQEIEDLKEEQPNEEQFETYGNIKIGPLTLVYKDSQMPYTMDASWATLKNPDGTITFFETAMGKSPYYYRHSGPLNNPLQTELPPYVFDYNGYNSVWHLYVYYDETNDSNPCSSLSVARGKTSDLVAAIEQEKTIPFFKYFEGKWEQPGINGSASCIIPEFQYNFDFHSDAVYCQKPGKYLLTVQTHDLGKLLLYQSLNGINWENASIILEYAKGYMHPYSYFFRIWR